MPLHSMHHTGRAKSLRVHHICLYTIIYTCVWRSVDNMDELVLFFHCVGSGIKLRSVVLMHSVFTY